MRKTFGEFDWPDRNASRAYIRNAFLDTIASHAPDVCNDLYDDAFRCYREIGSFHYGYAQDIHSLLTTPQPLLSYLKYWMVKWNLEKDWVLERAYHTLKMWSYYSQRPAKLTLDRDGWGGARPQQPPPPDGLFEYDPIIMYRERYLDEIGKKAIEAIESDPILKHGELSHRQAFIESIKNSANTYCHDVEKHYKRAGFPRSRSNEKRNLGKHLVWTVKFQVQGQSFSAIAEAEGVERTTISRAVRGILEIIELDQRPDAKQGRPKGKSNRPASKILRELGR